mgnify:CR=1 FL=1
MRYAINLNTKTIVDQLPDNATENHKFLVNNGYGLLELENPYKEDGSFRELTKEELAPYVLKSWKKDRQIKLDNLEVSYSDVVYQADETSQDRMARAILNILDGESIKWVAKDNSVQILTKEDLKQIARLAGQAQTEIWIKE